MAKATRYTDETAPRIRAFLDSVEPLQGVADAGMNNSYLRGALLIERMAGSATDCDMPKLRLTVAQCADVLRFLHSTEPVEPKHWWRDPKNAPSHLVGYHFVLQVLEESLRSNEARPRRRRTASGDKEASAPAARLALVRS